MITPSKVPVRNITLQMNITKPAYSDEAIVWTLNSVVPWLEDTLWLIAGKILRLKKRNEILKAFVGLAFFYINAPVWLSETVRTG